MRRKRSREQLKNDQMLELVSSHKGSPYGEQRGVVFRKETEYEFTSSEVAGMFSDINTKAYHVGRLDSMTWVYCYRRSILEYLDEGEGEGRAGRFAELLRRQLDAQDSMIEDYVEWINAEFPEFF